MPIWLWILIAIVVVSWLSYLWAWNFLSGIPSISEERQQRLSLHATLYIPGILARAKESISGLDDQSLGVIDVLREQGDIYFVDYAKELFSAERTTNMVLRKLERLLRDYRDVTIVGVSMGGMIAHDALASVDRNDRHRIRLILVDSPSGASSLGSGGNIFAPILRWLPIPIGRGMLLGSLSAPSAAPKDHEIQDGLDKEAVKRVAKQRLSGFRLRVYLEQLRYMASFRLCPSNFAGLAGVRYIACTKGNVTVKQPRARDAWLAAAPRSATLHYAVEMPHAAFLQQPNLSMRVMRSAFEN